MKWFFKWGFRLALLLVVLLAALLLSLDSIFKALIERQVRAGTGMDVKIGKLSVGLLSPVITMENLKLYNPAEFGGTPFLDIRELHLEYDRAAFARRTLHVKLMRLDLAELTVVKSDAGRTNLVILQPAPPLSAPRPDEWTFSGVDVLNLTVGTVRFVDLKNMRKNREFKPDLHNQIFKDVKTTADLYGILFMIWLRSGGGIVHDATKPQPLASPTHVYEPGRGSVLTRQPDAGASADAPRWCLALQSPLEICPRNGKLVAAFPLPMELTLEDWFTELDSHRETIPLDVLTDGMKRLRLDFADVEKFAQFSAERYRRNLLHAGPAYHALLLCWRNGQRSPIHDHRGSACAVRVIRGEVTETIFEMTEEGHVFPTRTNKLSEGFISATQDLDIHQLSNLQLNHADLVTLHIYSPPLLVMGQYSLTDPSVREYEDAVHEYIEGAGI